MNINYEAHKVFELDYLNENLGFVAGVLELYEQASTAAGGYINSNVHWVLDEANTRIRDILDQVNKAAEGGKA